MIPTKLFNRKKKEISPIVDWNTVYEEGKNKLSSIINSIRNTLASLTSKVGIISSDVIKLKSEVADAGKYIVVTEDSSFDDIRDNLNSKSPKPFILKIYGVYYNVLFLSVGTSYVYFYYQEHDSLQYLLKRSNSYTISEYSHNLTQSNFYNSFRVYKNAGYALRFSIDSCINYLVNRGFDRSLATTFVNKFPCEIDITSASTSELWMLIQLISADYVRVDRIIETSYSSYFLNKDTSKKDFSLITPKILTDSIDVTGTVNVKNNTGSIKIGDTVFSYRTVAAFPKEVEDQEYLSEGLLEKYLSEASMIYCKGVGRIFPITGTTKCIYEHGDGFRIGDYTGLNLEGDAEKGVHDVNDFFAYLDSHSKAYLRSVSDLSESTDKDDLVAIKEFTPAANTILRGYLFNQGVGAYANTSSGNIGGGAAFGLNNRIENACTFVAGRNNKVSGTAGSSLGYRNVSSGPYAHAIGYENQALGDTSFVGGWGSIASGKGSSALGWLLAAKGGMSISVIGNWTAITTATTSSDSAVCTYGSCPDDMNADVFDECLFVDNVVYLPVQSKIYRIVGVDKTNKKITLDRPVGETLTDTPIYINANASVGALSFAARGIAKGNSSWVINRGGYAAGAYSFVAGNCNRAYNSGETALGTFNAKEADCLLSVGNGTSISARSNAFWLSKFGDGTFARALKATSFIVTGGTSGQFLKADGSLDSSIYLTESSLENYYTKTQIDNTIGNIKTLIDNI